MTNPELKAVKGIMVGSALVLPFWLAVGYLIYRWTQ